MYSIMGGCLTWFITSTVGTAFYSPIFANLEISWIYLLISIGTIGATIYSYKIEKEKVSLILYLVSCMFISMMVTPIIITVIIPPNIMEFLKFFIYAIIASVGPIATCLVMGTWMEKNQKIDYKLKKRYKGLIWLGLLGISELLILSISGFNIIVLIVTIIMITWFYFASMENGKELDRKGGKDSSIYFVFRYLFTFLIISVILFLTIFELMDPHKPDLSLSKEV